MTPTDAPAKCAPMKCETPGSKPCCQLCPESPTYWRRTEKPEPQTAD